MAENTTIEWCDHTFNPWIGCARVSPGCDNCYAEKLAHARLGVAWGVKAERRRTAPSTWRMPLRWQRRAIREHRRFKVFCASLADVFDKAIQATWRNDLAALILATPNLDWLLLTKRIGNAEAMLATMFPAGIPKNLRLGITIVNQEECDRDLPRLSKVKRSLGIASTFLSMEPLLGPVVFAPGQLDDVDHVIVGGEAGPGARAMHPAWVTSIQRQCDDAGVAFLFKQWGDWAPMPSSITSSGNNAPAVHHWPDGSRSQRLGKKAAGRLLGGITHTAFPAGDIVYDIAA